MAFFVAALITLVLAVLFEALHGVPWLLDQVRSHLLRAIGSPNYPLIDRSIEWLAMPVLCTLFCTFVWLLLVLLFGRPGPVLRRYGARLPDAAAGQIQQAFSVRGGFWQFVLRCVACRWGSGGVTPFLAFFWLALLGVLLGAGAVVLGMVTPGTDFPLAHRPTIPFAAFLVVIAMGRAQVAARRILAPPAPDAGEKVPLVPARASAASAAASLVSTAAVVTSEPVMVREEPD